MDIEAYLRGDYISGLIKQKKRFDGRDFNEARELKLTNDYVKDKSCGSCLVELGKTKVLVGISMDVGTPYPDRPNDGVMTTSAEFRPMASPRFESGPPGEDSIEAARVIDRGIRESGSIDTSKLIAGDNLVWIVFIDIHILDHSGNLIDAGGLAAISALLNTRMPKIEDGKIIRGEFDGKLPMTCAPVPCTFSKIGNSVVLDPDLYEEYATDARLTVTTTDTINAMQKGGKGYFKEDEIMAAVDLAFKRGKEVRQQMEGD